MGQLWEMYEAHLVRVGYRVSQRQIAERIGVSPGVLGNWRDGLTRMPHKENLVRFADEIKMPYVRVLDAALHDAGYLPEARARDASLSESLATVARKRKRRPLADGGEQLEA